MTPIKTALAPLTLWLPGRVVPKARPRFNSGQAYLPQNYREWKRIALIEVLSQLGDRTGLPFSSAAVEIGLTGKHRGDLDNLAGSILDVLVEVKILADDRLSCVPQLGVTHSPNGECGTMIMVSKLDC